MNTAGNIQDDLMALATSNKRPEMARLREIFDRVDAALAAGASRADVLEALKKHGFKMNMPTFDNMLHRLRKERAKQGAPEASAQPARKPAGSKALTEPAPSTRPRPTPASIRQTLHEPIDLDDYQ